MRPSLDERVAAKDFFNLARRRCVQAQELHIMTRVSFMDRDDVGRVIIEGGEPFFFLFFWPVFLRGRDVVIGLVGAFLEWTGRVHRSKRGGPEILRCLLHLRSDFRWDADQTTA